METQEDINIPNKLLSSSKLLSCLVLSNNVGAEQDITNHSMSFIYQYVIKFFIFIDTGLAHT